MIVDQKIYRKAFQEYLRKGTPIMWSIKQERPTTHYIWRTRRDGKVRSAHAEREGQIFAWDNPPSGGHPGEDYNCRCAAKPYYGNTQEYVEHELKGISASASRWENVDFIDHFYTGGGRNVTLSEIGHLSEIAEHWAYELGIFEGWTSQIIIEARNVQNGGVTKQFNRSYSFRNVEFSHGGSTVTGNFVGTVKEENGMLQIVGHSAYEFSDVFTDPVDLREFSAWMRERPDQFWWFLQNVGALVGLSDGPSGSALDIDPDDVSRFFRLVSEIGGSAYDISGQWRSSLKAVVFVDKEMSEF